VKTAAAASCGFVLGSEPVTTRSRRASSKPSQRPSQAQEPHYLVPGVGLVHLASQTEEAVVAVSDYEELDAAMAASVEEAQHAAEAKCQATAADGLVTAIINRKRIQMDSVRYNVMWCEGEA